MQDVVLRLGKSWGRGRCYTQHYCLDCTRGWGETTGVEEVMPTCEHPTATEPAMFVYQCPNLRHERWIRPVTDEDHAVLAKLAEEIRRRGVR